MSENTNQEKQALKRRLKSKEHRVAFVSASVDQTIPFQIKALRLSKERNWTQEELARRANMKQERISACENQTQGKFNINTLKQLASAFDVGLIVRFAPFSELVEWEVNMSSESLEVRGFGDDLYFKEKAGDYSEAEILAKYYSSDAAQQTKQPTNEAIPHSQKTTIVLKMSEYKQKHQYGIEQQAPIAKPILEDSYESAIS